MSEWGKFFKSLFVDDMNNPPKRQEMSPKEMLDYIRAHGINITDAFEPHTEKDAVKLARLYEREDRR